MSLQLLSLESDVYSTASSVHGRLHSAQLRQVFTTIRQPATPDFARLVHDLSCRPDIDFRLSGKHIKSDILSLHLDQELELHVLG